jgi:hypothetical protein
MAFINLQFTTIGDTSMALVKTSEVQVTDAPFNLEP